MREEVEILGVWMIGKFVLMSKLRVLYDRGGERKKGAEFGAHGFFLLFLKQWIFVLKLIESGEKEKLMELLRERLIECGWRDEMKAICRFGSPRFNFCCYII